MEDTNREELEFFEGPHSRWSEFVFAGKVFLEFIKGFRALHFSGPCVTVFGSARFKPDHEQYKLAEEFGRKLAKLGFTVLTGGGPGIMEAANKGAKEVGGKSIGCNIILPHEQRPNPYLDKWVNMKYFFVRKVLLTKYSYAFVVMPGGFGTLDELFEAVTLIQNNKIHRFPVVLFGKEFHKHIIAHLNLMVEHKTISPKDLELFLITDSVDESIEYIKSHTIERYNLRAKEKPSQILGEV